MGRVAGKPHPPGEREAKIAQMAQLLKAGLSTHATAVRLDVSSATVYIWKKELESRNTAAKIAAEIRRELVCPCSSYDRGTQLRKMRHGDEGYDAGQQELRELMRGHAVCYWGEASARIAERFGEDAL